MSTEQQSAGASSAKAEETARVVTVITTRGDKKKIEYTGTTWGDFKKVLEREGYSLGSMKALEGTTKRTLESNEALLPEGNFNLFLMPYKNKSGGAIKEIVKQLFFEDRETAKAHFGNYTQIKEDVLAKSIQTYTGSNPTQIQAAKEFLKPVIKEKKSTVAKVEEKQKDKAVHVEQPKVEAEVPKAEIPKSKAAPVAVKEALTNLPAGTVESEVRFIDQLLTTLQVRRDILIGRGAINAAPSISKEDQAKLDQQIKDAEEKKQKKEADEKETRELQAQMRGMANGLRDVASF